MALRAAMLVPVFVLLCSVASAQDGAAAGAATAGAGASAAASTDSEVVLDFYDSAQDAAPTQAPDSEDQATVDRDKEDAAPAQASASASASASSSSASSASSESSAAKVVPVTPVPEVPASSLRNLQESAPAAAAAAASSAASVSAGSSAVSSGISQAPVSAPFPATLELMVKKIEDGELDNGFYWGKDLAPPGDFTTMFGKVAGCLLHKAETIMVTIDAGGNNTRDIDVPPRFFRNLGQDMASCCGFHDKRSWCIKSIAQAYTNLAHLAQVFDSEDQATVDGDKDAAMLAQTFGVLTTAANELLIEFQEGHSDRAGSIIATCSAGAASCTAVDIERLRQSLPNEQSLM